MMSVLRKVHIENLVSHKEDVMEKKIRNLYAEEIECRIGSIGEKGLSLLLYKDARVDQNLLDETYGVLGWRRSHEKIGDALYCTVSVKDEEGNWVSKQDVGTESYSEAVKGAASDSFKRACFNFGIGRELYTAPFIWISAEKTDIRHDGKKYVSKDHFKVNQIEYDDKRNIHVLQIVNQKGDVVYNYNKVGQVSKTQGSVLTRVQQFRLKSEMERTGVSENEITNRYHLQDINTMSEETYERVMSALEKTKNLAA